MITAAVNSVKEGKREKQKGETGKKPGFYTGKAPFYLPGVALLPAFLLTRGFFRPVFIAFYFYLLPCFGACVKFPSYIHNADAGAVVLVWEQRRPACKPLSLYTRQVNLKRCAHSQFTVQYKLAVSSSLDY
jgi:hypothetical protein